MYALEMNIERVKTS